MSSIFIFIDRLNEWIGSKVAWISSFLVVLICIDVSMRYLFHSSENWILELEWYLFGFLFLVSAAYTLKHDKHVRVDLFYENFSKRRKALVNLFGSLFLLIPWCLVAIMTSWDYAMNSFYFREGSSNANGMPARYVVKFAITLAFALLFLQAISLVRKSWLELRNQSTEE